MRRSCEWLVVDRPCALSGNREFADLHLCTKHLTALLERIEFAMVADASVLNRVKSAVRSIEREALDRERAEEKAAHAQAQAAALVYFAEREGFVKIGHATNVAGRLKALASGGQSVPGMRVGPLQLLATMPGGRAREKVLHGRFAHLRIGGEWFLPDDEMWAFMRALEGFVGDRFGDQDQQSKTHQQLMEIEKRLSGMVPG